MVYGLKFDTGEYYRHSYSQNVAYDRVDSARDASVWVAEYLAQNAARILHDQHGIRLQVVPVSPDHSI